MVVSGRYLKKNSCNPIQTQCVHLLGECSEMICFLATLAKFCPSSGHKWLKMVVSDHYLEKYSRNPIFVCTLIGCVFRNDLLLALLWPQNDWKYYGGFHHYLKKYSCNPIQTWCVHLLVSVQNWFAFCLRWPNFGPLVATKYWKWLFPTFIWKSILAIQFKLGVYTYWVNV